MAYLYSASTNAFYPTDAPEWANIKVPDDAVEITDQQYNDLFAETLQGKRIVPGADGYPTTEDIAEQEITDAMADAEVARQEDDIAFVSLIEVMQEVTGDDQIGKKVKDKMKQKYKDKNKDDTTTTV